MIESTPDSKAVIPAPLGSAWSFLWCYSEDRHKEGCWRARGYKGTFEQACSKMARFLEGRKAFWPNEVVVDQEARRDDPHEQRSHQDTFVDLSVMETPLKEYV